MEQAMVYKLPFGRSIYTVTEKDLTEGISIVNYLNNLYLYTVYRTSGFKSSQHIRTAYPRPGNNNQRGTLFRLFHETGSLYYSNFSIDFKTFGYASRHTPQGTLASKEFFTNDKFTKSFPTDTRVSP